MSEKNGFEIYPKSPREEVGGLPYLARMCDKIRLHAHDELHEDYQQNLGRGFDKWICEFLGVEYDAVVAKVGEGLDDEAILDWAVSTGGERSECEKDWWLSYMRNRGHGDDLNDILAMRKVENGMKDRVDILNFFDFIDADEGRL